MTSHDAVSFLRRLIGIKRIGHTGTLDPMAAGVLPLCIGSATRIVEYLDIDFKQYRCELQLGMTTNTLDIWGNKLTDRRADVSGITEEAIRQSFEPFAGEIQQIPPKYSAIKVDGKRLYEYARQGQEVEIKPRTVSIKEVSIVNVDKGKGRVTFDITCSKGTYIRSICRDVGDALGCGGTMSFLLRTASGRFDLSDSVTIEELKEGFEKYLLPVDYPLIHFGRFVLPSDRAFWFASGGTVCLREGQIGQEPGAPAGECENAYCVYGGEVFRGVAMYNHDKKEFKPNKVFGRQGI